MKNKNLSTQNVIFNKIWKLRANNSYTNRIDFIEDIQAMLNDDKRINKKYVIVHSNESDVAHVVTEKEVVEIQWEGFEIVLR